MRRPGCSRSGLQAGIIDDLATHPGTDTAGVAERRGLHPPYTDAWCRTAHALKVIDVDSAGYRLADEWSVPGYTVLTTAKPS